MHFKMFKLITGELIVSKVYSEAAKVVTLENPMYVDITYSEDLKPVFRYLPWQVIAEVSRVEISTSNIVFSTAPKSELLTIYMNICTQMDNSMRGGSSSPVAIQELEATLNHDTIETV